MTRYLVLLLLLFPVANFSQIFIPFGFWGKYIYVSSTASTNTNKCPSSAAGTLNIVLPYTANFTPDTCSVSAQSANFNGIALCLCVSGVCTVSGLKLNNSFLEGMTPGSDSTITDGLTYTIGTTQVSSPSSTTDVVVTTGTWTPFCLGTVISAWYDANDGTTVRTGVGGASQAADGNGVSVWQDKSGNTRDATQATAGDQPLFRANANASGYPGIQTVSNDFFNMPSTMLTGAAATYVAIVTQDNTSGNWARYFDFGSSTTSNYFATQSNGTNSRLRITTSGAGGEQGVTNGTSVNNNRTVLLFQHTGTALTIYRDAATTGTANVATTIAPSAVGNTQNYIAKSQYADPYYNGWFQEFLVVNSTITSAQRIILEGYLAQKWGLAGVLPGAHTYKTFAP